jgi:putative protein-disulfide isomerase
MCAPRRSTYPSNRAVIAARMQGDDFDEVITGRIQRAYYLQARNPSDNDTLIELAADSGLDAERFGRDLTAAETQQKLLSEIETSRRLGIDSFPSLAVGDGGRLTHIGLNYTDAKAMLNQIEALIE